jgi:hypothetical protein
LTSQAATSQTFENSFFNKKTNPILDILGTKLYFVNLSSLPQPSNTHLGWSNPQTNINMHYPNKPHFKILSSVVLSVLQYYLLTSGFISTRNQEGEMASFGVLILDALLLSYTLGSTAIDIKKQFRKEIKHELALMKNEIVKAERQIEDQIEKFEHVVLDEATLLLGAKVYRRNPILSQFD